MNPVISNQQPSASFLEKMFPQIFTVQEYFKGSSNEFALPVILYGGAALVVGFMLWKKFK